MQDTNTQTTWRESFQDLWDSGSWFHWNENKTSPLSYQRFVNFIEFVEKEAEQRGIQRILKDVLNSMKNRRISLGSGGACDWTIDHIESYLSSLQDNNKDHE